MIAGREWMQNQVQNYLVQVNIKSSMDMFPLVASLRKSLQDFMDRESYFIKNDPMVFITTQFKEVKDEYTHFIGIENGSGYREWCSFDKNKETGY